MSFVKPRLRAVLFIAFSIMSVIPVLLLGWWAVDSARENEYSAVKEKHLLVAEHLTLALSRYAQDTESILEYISSSPMKITNSAHYELLWAQNITSIRFFNSNHVQQVGISTGNGVEPTPLTIEQLKTVDENSTTPQTIFLPAQLDGNGQPKILIITPAAHIEGYLVAEMSTEYFLKLQEQVKFGELGHAAIVDQTGNVLAHPNPDWAKQIKNIAKVSSVKRMMNRETGVEQFYSPAKKADMIAGLSFVKETGWGAMVPQPISELEDRIEYIKNVTLGIGLIGMALAMLISWFLANIIARPTQQLALLANHFKVNDISSESVLVTSHTREQHELSTAFDNMIHALRSKNSQLLYHSQHDPLTGLANRKLLREYLNQAIVEETPFIFALLDLDDFKDINDHWSHAHGDELLIHVANRLVDITGQRGLVARIGGDEFAIAFNTNISIESAERIVEELRNKLTLSYQVIDETLKIDCCCGLSRYPQDAQNRSDLMQCADLAMYAAKVTNNTHVQWYKPRMRADLNSRVELTQSLREAIKQNQFIIHYQPKVDAISHKIQGFEALVRWQHPTRGLIYPESFISLAENTGQIIPLGRLIIDTVCKDLAIWKREASRTVPIAINLSVKQFDSPNLASMIIGSTNRYNLAAEDIEFEITESVFAKHSERVETILQELTSFGFEISIDDFGTEQSSLSRLKDFEFNKIKIDKAFIAESDCNIKAAGILKSVVNMGHTLQLPVIVEGIETHKQLSLVQSLGCDQIQGFLFSTGVDFPTAVQMLERDVIPPAPEVTGQLTQPKPSKEFSHMVTE